MIPVWRELVRPTPSSLMLLVLDGVGGIPHPERGRTELEAARTPNLDDLAARSACGLADPVAPGVTPGSGPGHLALFGYDPAVVRIGRGALSAAGVGFALRSGDVAARANFCTIDSEGRVVDRRGGRIPTETAKILCGKIAEAVADGIEGVEVRVLSEREHRAAVIFRGEGLSDALSDSDPQKTGVPPLEPAARESGAERMAGVADRFLEVVREAIGEEGPANGMLLRGFAKPPELEPFAERTGLQGAAIAVYPMYRGLASLVGMEAVGFEGESVEDEIAALENLHSRYTFRFLHVKGTDSAGEDGDFDRKTAVIESVDALLPRILKTEPDVLAITGDHSTPSAMRQHSFHPSPVLLHAANAFADGEPGFHERRCARGMLGRFRMPDLIPLMLAHGGKLAKFGA